MKTALAILAATTVLVLLLILAAPDRPAPAAADLPWQIEVQPDGTSRVFGLTLGRGTLADARARFGPEPQVAIVTAPGEAGSLEAYFETVSLGFFTGKMVVTLEVAQDAVERMRTRAAKTEHMESITRKATLAAADREFADRAPIRAIAFVPSAHLEEATILERFGQPAERLRDGEHVEHFLYPAKGLDVILDRKGKEVLQYVAPRDFARLREPLTAPRANPDAP
ncbi:hypothetical protein [Sulfurisoma sediminicola]|uniref:Uncharacterized protein n=1 Tax=Sulfurisoma sediminicola TaxID=1381557 RepID=A0A497XE72_9PROT|nr:hypothetical protein [Sulfurisoma sediminicola]RLJ65263.1 hypothetical protein DFR35_1921 [Sulfurisoma sediminicola]